MKFTLWRSICLAAMAMTLAIGSGCSPSGPESPTSGAKPAGDTIKVGEFASLTGKEATFGQASHRGTILAIEEINARGGVLGRKLELISEDNQSKPGESVTVVRKLISSDKVVAVLGEVASGRSLEAAPICQAAHVPQISPSSTNPQVTEKGDYIFRVCFIDPFQGTVMARFAMNTLKFNSVAVFTDASAPYSVGLATYFKERFLKDGGKIVIEQKYNSGDKDFKAQLTAIKAQNPQALFVPGYYTEVGLIAMQARQLGITVPLLGGDGWESPKLTEIGGQAMEGCYYSTHFSPEEKNPQVEEFVKKCVDKFKEKPDAMVALGYDSAMLLADAIKRAGSVEGAKVRDALAATKDYQAVTGRITLDANRNASKSAVILQIQSGAFKYLETVQP